MTTFLLMPLESVLPEGWRESLDPFAPLPPEQDVQAAHERSEQLTGELAARCAAIDAQLRERLTDDVELTYLAGMRAWSAKVSDGMSHTALAESIGNIPVQIMPEATFTTL
ncbi:hypothetical protein [Blastomonas sp. SL216]|uniref:hypothetical protein n=1 Tax=Blastomonas sp. SL216 TaxID=2995169 RepID=UPI002376E597|nr:hypothetical protein OU999_08455 [Blastomonas sp. SL216]